MTAAGAHHHDATDAADGFGPVLRAWRRHRGWSQLQLSTEAEVSPRHVSFLETGRSRPSREMVLRLVDTLDVPLRDRNRALLAAGFAPAYAETSLGAERMAQVHRAVRLLLDRHDPYPAYALDGAWNVVAANRTHHRFLDALLPAERRDETNLLRLLLAPDLLRPAVANWPAVAAAVLRRVHRQLDRPAASSQLAALMADLRRDPDVHRLASAPPNPDAYDVVVPVTLRLGDHHLSWLTTLVTFAAPVDVTVDELVVECFFPADEGTERWVEGG